MSQIQQFPVKRMCLFIVWGNKDVCFYVNGKKWVVFNTQEELLNSFGTLLFNKMTIMYQYGFVIDTSIEHFPETQNELSEKHPDLGIPLFDETTAFIKNETVDQKEHVKFFAWFDNKGVLKSVYTRESAFYDCWEQMTVKHDDPHVRQPYFHEVDEYIRNKVQPGDGWTQVWFGDDRFKSVDEIWEHHEGGNSND